MQKQVAQCDVQADLLVGKALELQLLATLSAALNIIDYCALSNSTSKISVALGGMTPPAPLAP